jgi:hypothetical protein
MGWSCGNRLRGSSCHHAPSSVRDAQDPGWNPGHLAELWFT